MRTIIYILTFIFSTTLLCGQAIDKKVRVDTLIYNSRECTNCPVMLDTVIYKLMDCGLYKGSNGDIGYRSTEIYNDNINRRTRYITRIYGAEPKDTLNGGLKEIKYVIDTASFKFLSYLYWSDKNNVYSFTPTSDGGTIFLNKLIDRKSFKVFEGTEYAKDKKHIYYHNSIMEGADTKTFKVINNKEISELAYDKNYIYRFGERLTDKEINEWKLEKYRR